MIESALVVLAVIVPLLVGAVVLLGRRLDRLQERLARLDDLETLAERVRALSKELKRKELNDQLQSKLTELGEAQSRGAAALGELERQVAELLRGMERRVREEREERPPAADELGARVRHHLASEGHQAVRLLTDLGSLSGRSGRVVFESRRHGVMHKGHVVLSDGEITDETVRSAYGAFP